MCEEILKTIFGVLCIDSELPDSTTSSVKAGLCFSYLDIPGIYYNS